MGGFPEIFNWINKKFKIDNLEFKSDLNVNHLIVNNKNVHDFLGV